MSDTNVKDEARRLVTWDHLMYQIYVRQAIEAGLEDSEAGRTHNVKEVRNALGLSK